MHLEPRPPPSAKPVQRPSANNSKKDTSTTAESKSKAKTAAKPASESNSSDDDIPELLSGSDSERDSKGKPETTASKKKEKSDERKDMKSEVQKDKPAVAKNSARAPTKPLPQSDDDSSSSDDLPDLIASSGDEMDKTRTNVALKADREKKVGQNDSKKQASMNQDVLQAAPKKKGERLEPKKLEKEVRKKLPLPPMSDSDTDGSLPDLAPGSDDDTSGVIAKKPVLPARYDLSGESKKQRSAAKVQESDWETESSSGSDGHEDDATDDGGDVSDHSDVEDNDVRTAVPPAVDIQSIKLSLPTVKARTPVSQEKRNEAATIIQRFWRKRRGVHVGTCSSATVKGLYFEDTSEENHVAARSLFNIRKWPESRKEYKTEYLDNAFPVLRNLLNAIRKLEIRCQHKPMMDENGVINKSDITEYTTAV
jgi:hypothetical protein